MLHDLSLHGNDKLSCCRVLLSGRVWILPRLRRFEASVARGQGSRTLKEGSNVSHHPEHFRKDLNPDYQAGQNHGLEGEQYEEGAKTAYDYKDIQELLPDWSGSDLRELTIVPEGTQLQQGAVYFDLRNPQRGEFKARGDMIAEKDSRLVPKDRVSFDLWNRLTSAGARGAR